MSVVQFARRLSSMKNSKKSSTNCSGRCSLNTLSRYFAEFRKMTREMERLLLDHPPHGHQVVVATRNAIKLARVHVAMLKAAPRVATTRPPRTLTAEQEKQHDAEKTQRRPSSRQ